MKSLIAGVGMFLIVVYILCNMVAMSIMGHLADTSGMTLEEFDHKYVRWFSFKSMKDVEEVVERKRENGEIRDINSSFRVKNYY
jgi:hypothetical protein